MGYRQTDHKQAVDYAREEFYIELTNGTLVSATLSTHGSNIRDTQIYASLRITEGDPDFDRTLFALVSGHLGTYSPLTWHGTQPISNDLFLVCDVTAPQATKFRFICYTLDAVTASTGIPRDP